MEITRAAANSRGLQLVQILGKGNYGSAYLVRDQKNHLYALKEIPKNNFYDMEWTSSQLVVGKSDYVIRLYKKFEHGPNIYILMEYANKKSLENLLQVMKPYSVDISVNILFQILNGVQTIHENHLTHRDLKPANILMHQVKGNQFITLKIADFGLSRPITEQELARTYCGTPLHMAPEILLSDEAEYDERVDIWSVGTIFYQLLTGNFPFPARSLDHLKKLIQEPLPRTPLIPDDCWDLLQGMLMVDPVNRFSAYRCLCSPLFKTCWAVLKRTGPPGAEVTHHVLMKGDKANRAFSPYISLTESISRRMAAAGPGAAAARATTANTAAAGAAAAAQPATVAAGAAGKMAAFSAFVQHALTPAAPVQPAAAALTRVPPPPGSVPSVPVHGQVTTPQRATTTAAPADTPLPSTPAAPTHSPTAPSSPSPSAVSSPSTSSASSSPSSSSSSSSLPSSPSSSSTLSSSEPPDVDLFRSISIPNVKEEPELKKDGLD